MYDLTRASAGVFCMLVYIDRYLKMTFESPMDAVSYYLLCK
jgi:hypothetical protein